MYFCRDPFIQKVSFVRCQTSVDALALICYLTVLTSLAMNRLFFAIQLNEIWSSFFCLGFEFLPLCEVKPASFPRKIMINPHEIFMPN